MNRSPASLVLAAALGLAALGPLLLAGEADAPPKPVADRDLGLSKTGVFEVPSPPAVVDPEAEPGEASLLPRAYPGAPPRVPHAIADLLPITRRDNLCVDCHLIDEAVEGGPTPIPASHKTDLRNAPGRIGEGVVGARWVCVSCHVPVTGAPPLVGNDFTSPSSEPAAEPDAPPPGGAAPG